MRILVNNHHRTCSICFLLKRQIILYNLRIHPYLKITRKLRSIDIRSAACVCMSTYSNLLPNINHFYLNQFHMQMLAALQQYIIIYNILNSNCLKKSFECLFQHMSRICISKINGAFYSVINPSQKRLCESIAGVQLKSG